MGRLQFTDIAHKMIIGMIARNLSNSLDLARIYSLRIRLLKFFGSLYLLATAVNGVRSTREDPTHDSSNLLLTVCYSPTRRAPVSSNPWVPLESAKFPTTSPCALIPKARVDLTPAGV